MSNILNFVSEETYIDKMDRQNALLAAIASNGGGTAVESWEDVKRITRMGLADKVFAVGDRLDCMRGQTALSWDIVDIKPSELTLLLHYLISNMQFGASQAVYYAADGLPAGSYYFLSGGTPYSFTITQAVPSGGQICISSDLTEVCTFACKSATAALESGISVANAATGTDITVGINDLNCARYGSNNYENSAVRQWLNSSEAAGSVWTPKTDFDRPPAWYSTLAGFMNGLDSDFLDAVSVSDVVTAKNAVTDGGGSVTLSDKFFLPSRYEMYAGNENDIAEGEEWQIYSAMADEAITAAAPERTKYYGAIARAYFLRSPNTAIVNTGYVRSFYPNGALTYMPSNSVSYVSVACKIKA